MLKTAIMLLVLLAAPFLIYYGYFLWARQRAVATGQPPPAFGDGPMGWLAITGLGLCVVFFIVLAVFGKDIMGDAEPDGTYVPPRYEDGRIVPGYTIPAEKPGESQQ